MKLDCFHGNISCDSEELGSLGHNEQFGTDE